MINPESYQEQLLEELKDPQESAAYLWAILQEKEPEAELLESSLQDVLEALGNAKYTPKQVEKLRYNLAQLMTKKGSEAIYELVNLLEILGLELTIKVKDSVEHTKLSKMSEKEAIKL